jgi:hypothetical protein
LNRTVLAKFYAKQNIADPMTNTLKVFTVGAEIVVVSTLAVSSYHVAFSGSSPDWLAGAPILTVVALESLRLPLAFRLRRMRALGRAMSIAMLVGLSVITGEAASVAFENLIFQRSRPVVEAEAELKKVEISHDSLAESNNRHAQEIKRLTMDLDAANAHRVSIDKPVAFLPPPPDRPCTRTVVGKKKKKIVVAANCAAPVQAEAVRSNADAQTAHSAELKSADALIQQARTKLDAAEGNPPDMRAPDEALAQAKQKVADARALNPMFRVAAAWQKVPVQDLNSNQFEQVKHWAVLALAGATAGVTMLAAVISSLPERNANGGKVKRAVRAWLARRRRPLTVYRDVPGPLQVREKMRVVYVPCDPATGKVLDPDAGEARTVAHRISDGAEAGA